MSAVIDKMLADARRRARSIGKKGYWWESLTPQTLDPVYREALAKAGFPAAPKLMNVMRRTFTWEGYFVPHREAGVDPIKNMVKALLWRMSGVDLKA
jgi:hypothetical protein